MSFLNKKYFFGWESFKWNFLEFKKMYSARVVSFFSKKRIESGIAFIIMQWGMVYWFIQHVAKMTISELVVWASIEGVVCGYMINKIEKNNHISNKDETPKTDP